MAPLGGGATGTGWWCGVCRLRYPAAAEETADGHPQCPTCGAALRPYGGQDGEQGAAGGAADRDERGRA
jgi:hypothetical protein